MKIRKKKEKKLRKFKKSKINMIFCLQVITFHRQNLIINIYGLHIFTRILYLYTYLHVYMYMYIWKDIYVYLYV